MTYPQLVQYISVSPNVKDFQVAPNQTGDYPTWTTQLKVEAHYANAFSQDITADCTFTASTWNPVRSDKFSVNASGLVTQKTIRYLPPMCSPYYLADFFHPLQYCYGSCGGAVLVEYPTATMGTFKTSALFLDGYCADFAFAVGDNGEAFAFTAVPSNINIIGMRFTYLTEKHRIKLFQLDYALGDKVTWPHGMWAPWSHGMWTGYTFYPSYRIYKDCGSGGRIEGVDAELTSTEKDWDSVNWLTFVRPLAPGPTQIITWETPVWSSTNEAVATVEADGTIEAKGYGSCCIQVSIPYSRTLYDYNYGSADPRYEVDHGSWALIGSYPYTAPLTLNIPVSVQGFAGGVTSIEVSPKEVTKKVGEDQQYTAVGTLDTGESYDITPWCSWSAENNKDE